MSKLLKSNIFFYVLLFLLVLPSFWSMIRSGFFPMQDDMQAFRLLEMSKCFNDFQIPCRWVPDMGYGYGYPQFNFYAPGVYYLGQVFHFLGFQFVDTVKILFILGFIFGAFFMYKFIEELFGKIPALTASVLYTYAPFRATQVYVRGSLSEFWAMSLFPLVFWLSYKLIRNNNRRNFGLFSVSIFLLLISHNLLPMIILPILLIWIFCLMIFYKKPLANLFTLAISLLVGLLSSFFFILPLVLERKFVHSETLLSGYFDFRRHFVDLQQMFLSNNFGYGSSELGPGDDLSLSSGLVLIVAWLFCVVLVTLRIKNNKGKAILVYLLTLIELAVLFMMHLKSSFVWELIPILKWLQFPWRFLSISVFVLSFISAVLISLSKKMEIIAAGLLIVSCFFLHSSFFVPKSWQKISDINKFSGESWERQLTVSIGDYLPISAKFPPNKKALELPEVLEGNVKILNYYKGSNFQKGVFESSGKSVLRFPFFDFPGISVLVNGKKIDYRNNDCRGEDYCFGLVSFDLNSGKNEVTIALKNTPVRVASNVISIFSFLLLGITYLNYGKFKTK
jgi:hypothetical protein